jgi:hypothetical protein
LGQRKEDCSFLKKRTKKLLDFGMRGPASVHTKEQSLSLLFFRKEESFFTWPKPGMRHEAPSSEPDRGHAGLPLRGGRPIQDGQADSR